MESMAKKSHLVPALRRRLHALGFWSTTSNPIDTSVRIRRNLGGVLNFFFQQYARSSWPVTGPVRGCRANNSDFSIEKVENFQVSVEMGDAVLRSCSSRPIVAPIRVRMCLTEFSHGFAHVLAAGLTLRRVLPQVIRSGSGDALLALWGNVERPFGIASACLLVFERCGYLEKYIVVKLVAFGF